MMSIQELWYMKNRIGRGGLGYQYPRGGYGIKGGVLTDVTLPTWAPSYSGYSETDSWIPESTVTGFNPYPIGLDKEDRVMYEHTPEEEAFYRQLANIKSISKTRDEYLNTRKKVEEARQIRLAEEEQKRKDEFEKQQKRQQKVEDERRKKKIELENDIKKINSKIKAIDIKYIKYTKYNNQLRNVIAKTKNIDTLVDEINKITNKINKLGLSADEIKEFFEYNEEYINLNKQLDEKQNELDNLIAGGPIKEAEPDFFELLIQQEEANNIQLSEEELNELKTLPIVGPLIDKSIEYYDEKRNEYNNAPTIDMLTHEYISSYAKDKGIENNMAFEQITMQPKVTAKIISLLDSSYEESKIKDLQVINTEIGGEMIDIDGEKVTFNKDPNAPFDLIAIFKYNGKPVKFVIEDKFYNESSIHTTMKGVQGGKTVKVKYDEIMDFTNNEYKKYKEGILSEYRQAKKNYDIELEFGQTDDEIKEFNKKVYDQYHGLRNKIFNDKNKIDNDKLTQEYYRDRYVAAIPMKMSKTNFQYQKEKLIESGLTPKEYYKYIHDRGLTNKQKQVNVNNEGVITSISLPGKKDTPYGSKNPGFKLFSGSKILYCVSLHDALLGVNWSDMLKKDPNLVIDPFYKFKPVASAYGHEKGEASTDSIGIPFNTFKVLARHPTQPIQTTTRKSRQSRILDV